MNLHFTRTEYRTLVELLSIADRVMTADLESDDDIDRTPYQALIQKVFAKAQAMGCDDYIRYQPALGGFYETQAMEKSSPCHARFDAFESSVFWKTLVDSLATRDALGVEGEEAFLSKPLDAQCEAIDNARDRWAREFGAHGVKRLTVKPILTEV